MHEFTERDLNCIMEAAGRHLRGLGEELARAYPAAPDAAFTAAIGAVLCGILTAFPRFEDQSAAVAIVNFLLARLGPVWRMAAVGPHPDGGREPGKPASLPPKQETRRSSGTSFRRRPARG